MIRSDLDELYSQVRFIHSPTRVFQEEVTKRERSLVGGALQATREDRERTDGVQLALRRQRVRKGWYGVLNAWAFALNDTCNRREV